MWDEALGALLLLWSFGVLTVLGVRDLLRWRRRRHLRQRLLSLPKPYALDRAQWLPQRRKSSERWHRPEHWSRPTPMHLRLRLQLLRWDRRLPFQRQPRQVWCRESLRLLSLNQHPSLTLPKG